MKANIILGCEGRQDEGFYFCTGVKNVILDMQSVYRFDSFKDLIKYLDGVVGLFDSPCFKSHVISNAVYKIHEMGFIDEKKYRYICHFYELHKRCGLILNCQPKIDS